MSSRTPRFGVLALQGDVREHTAILEGIGQDVRQVRTPADLELVDALVIPGGESTTISRLALLFGLTDPITERIRAGMPAFGTCAGMIMLADEVLDGRDDQVSFGGIDMSVRRNAFGRQVDSFEQLVPIDGLRGQSAGLDDGLGDGLGDDLGDDQGRGLVPAVFIRAPWVERTGPGVRVIGRVAHDTPDGAGVADRIVAVRTDRLLATSFHPELTGDRRMHELFVDMVLEAL